MKSAWQGTLVDWAAVNSDTIEEVDLNEYNDLLEADNDAKMWDDEDKRFLFETDSDSDL
jgi:hypothetical protein